MITELSSLVALQSLDAEIATLNREILALPKRVAQIEAKLASARQRVDVAKAAVKTNELARRDFEHQIQGENTRIIKFREQSGSVKTNEQYKALLSEIDHAEKAIRSFEDKILDTMSELEKIQEEIKASEAALKSDSAIIEKEKTEATARTKETERLMLELTAKRNELRATVSDSMLAHYDRLMKGRGTAMAEARGQRCMGCQVLLRPQIWEEVRSGSEVRTCDGCARILYYDAERDTEKAPITNAPVVEREWLYVPAMGSHGAFVVLVNHVQKGTTTMKAWDAASGAALERRTEKNTAEHHAFGELVSAGRNLFVDEPNLEERYKDQLPPEFLLDLRHQLPAEMKQA